MMSKPLDMNLMIGSLPMHRGVEYYFEGDKIFFRRSNRTLPPCLLRVTESEWFFQAPGQPLIRGEFYLILSHLREWMKANKLLGR